MNVGRNWAKGDIARASWQAAAGADAVDTGDARLPSRKPQCIFCTANMLLPLLTAPGRSPIGGLLPIFPR